MTDALPSEEIVDEVEEEWTDRKMDVTVKQVMRSGYEEDTRWLKVYGTREETFASLDGGEPTTNERKVKIAEMPRNVATEVLFGLAEAYDYELETKR